jgi:NADH-quinone oxidoreductase subunit L
LNTTTSKYFVDHIWLIPLFPLAGAAIMFFIGRKLRNGAVSVICAGSVLVSFIYSLGAFFQLLGMPRDQRIVERILFEWVPAVPYHMTNGHLANFVADWGFLLDPLSAVMILVVTGVGFLIHIYSTGYMAHEGGYYRFFGYLNLFMFSMLMLVLANNLVLLFVGWEGVGTCSYLLIGFYFHRKSASDAGKKAFIVNRVGDAGFLLGIFLCSALLGTIRFTEIPHVLVAGGFQPGTALITAIALLFFWGATGKSAQLPLYVWLPDAMEGPTPVSALIHAATMVTAGVYMVTRTNAIFQLSPTAMTVVAIVGVVTAFFAASIGMVQNDIKKVLAYSTISQLGYMFVACGVGAFTAGIFHLMTHAFFKGLLFLAAGSVIHAMSGEQDMRKMGGLSKKIRTTYLTMLAATLAIAGLPPFAGFFSKDEILERAFEQSHLLWFVAWITAGMTAFYMFRLLFMTFWGEGRMDHEVEHHIHESPRSMTGPLVVLAVLSVIGGWIGIHGYFEHFLDPVIAPKIETAGQPVEQMIKSSFGPIIMAASVGLALAGIWLAWFFYVKDLERVGRLVSRFKGLHRLVMNKYYVDEIYDAAFVNRTKDLGSSLGALDSKVIDGLGVNGAAWLTRMISRISMWWDTWVVDGSVRAGSWIVWITSLPLRLVQNGLLQSYILIMVIGLIGFLGYTVYLLQHHAH